MAAGIRFGGSAHMKQGNRLEDLSLPTLICPPSCDCATAACVRVCSQAMGLEWTRNSLLWNRYKSRIWKSWEECSHRLEERDASWACEWARVNFSPMSPKLVRTYPHIVEHWRITMVSLFFEINLRNHIGPRQNQNVTSFLYNQLLLSVTFSVKENKSNSQSIWEKVNSDKDFDWLGRTLSWYQFQR